MKTILAVEDEETFRELLRAALERRGFRVLAAENASRGLELATAQRVDAVVTDYHMPKMNGLQLCRALAERSAAARGIPVWIMTGSVDLTAEDATAAGAAGVFRKPFRVQQVCDTLERHFADGAAAPQPPRA